MHTLVALLVLPALGVAAWARTRLQDRRHARAALDAVEVDAAPAEDVVQPAELLDPLLPEHVDPLLPLEQLVEVMAAWPQLVSSFYREDHVR